MEFEISYSLENEQQFWDELDDIISTPCPSHELIDHTLRTYLSLTTNYKGEYLQTEYDVARCTFKILESTVFKTNKDYVRRQIIHCLFQKEDVPDTVHLITAFLLYDGRQNETTLEMMNDEGIFPRLLELIKSKLHEDIALHRMLLELLYEMSRINRIRMEELSIIDDAFIKYLLEIIEGLSIDVNDPYHYPVIRVLLVLNEQYMVSAHEPEALKTHRTILTNKVIKVLSVHGSIYKTFGENIILLLNRESEVSLQLLILKLLYLIFTTSATYEYFYTNDLRVLVDVIIRNLLDLPLSATALRHTYLRVLYPLLAHTQLKNPDGHYKREELLKLLYLMTGHGGASVAHFGAVDETTKRLVSRCIQVKWLQAADKEQQQQDKEAIMNPRGISMHHQAGASSLSVLEVTAYTEKPGVQTPSRAKERTKATSREGVHVEPEDLHVGHGAGIPAGGGAITGLRDYKSLFPVGGEA